MSKGVNKPSATINRLTGTWFLVVAVLVMGCSATGYLKEGESFYAGHSIEFNTHGNISGRKSLRSELDEMVTPKPNPKFLGSRISVWIYFVTGGERNTKGIGGWIRKKFGKAPVLITDAKPEATANVLQGNLFNRGFFESTVQSSVEKKKKESKVVYDIELYPPFTIRQIEVPDDSIFVNKEEIMRESFIKEGDRYNLEKLSDEQSRLEMILEDSGFYYFDNRNLLFEADTTVGGRKVDLKLTYAPGTPEKAKRKYTLGQVDIINDYQINGSRADTTSALRRDTVALNGYRYASLNDNFRPEIIARVVNIDSGELYSRTAHNYTISHLMGLGTFRFVNIRYRETGPSQLGASVFLTPLKKKSFRLEVQGVSKSNNFVGPGLAATFTNRNFLRGAEQFRLKVDGTYEIQLNNQQTDPLTAVEFSAEASLSVPRMLLPINIEYYSTKFIPHTDFRLGSTFQRRIGYYQLNSFNAGFGYTWRETTTKSHAFYPIEVNYVDVSNTSQEFEDLLDKNPYLSNTFQDQFIPGMRYTFNLNTQLQDPGEIMYASTASRRGHFFFNGNFSLAGNLTNWLTPTPDPPDTVKTIVGQPFSQFVLGDVDFRYYWQMDRHNRLVARLALGAGYAYGNSKYLPYIKQFATGGSNSVRAFPARSLGPGTYADLSRTENVQFIDQRGDIKIEANLEYRFDIYRFFKGAVFLDAGNIWLWEEDLLRPGSGFEAGNILQELAVGTGLGIRLDFSFFILRFDLGIPLRKPWLEDGQWVARDIDLRSKDWRKDNLVLNIAIGYPF